MPDAPLSRQLLELLNALDYPDMRIDYLREHFEFMSEEDPLFESEEERREAEQVREIVRALMKSVVDRRIEPTLGSADRLSDLVLGRLGDAALDEYFTFEVLAAVPGIVRRWGRLRELLVGLPPNDVVRSYLRQATTCYLYGLAEASAVLCRAALEAALKEAIGRLGGVPIQELDLEGLVRLAGMSRRLNEELTGKAHRIRRVGNEAIHRMRCNESEAGVQMRETADVLLHLYGRS